MTAMTVSPTFHVGLARQKCYLINIYSRRFDEGYRLFLYIKHGQAELCV